MTMPAPCLDLTDGQQSQLLAELENDPPDAPLKAAVLVGRVPVTPALIDLLREIADFPADDQPAWRALYLQAGTLFVFCSR